MHTGRPERLPRFSYIGLHRYSLTFCTEQRRALFSSSERVESATAQILRAARDEGFAVIAYCFMPDHLHLLVQGQTGTSNLTRFIARAKQYSGYHHARRFAERLWQRYGYERVLREAESTGSVVKYLLENPIRAGLVLRIEDYPFSGSLEYTRQELIEYAYRDWSGSRSG